MFDFKKIFGFKKNYSKEDIDNNFYDKNQIELLIIALKNDFEFSKYKTLKLINKSPHNNPTFANIGDSGIDLRAWIKEDDEGAKFNKENGKCYIKLNSLERTLIHTGIYFDIPNDCEIQVRPRSGLALKQGLSICNTPGTVDTNYVNEVGIIAINLSKKPITIEDGDKIAQAVLMPVYNGYNVTLKEVQKINENEFRNMNGFGSSGVK